MKFKGIIALVVVQICVGICVAVDPFTTSNANNIFDALTLTLTCGQFQTLIKGAGLQTEALYKSQIRLTLFVPNNTAFQLLPSYRLKEIIDMVPTEKEDYVRFFTIGEELQTSGITENIAKNSLAINNNRLFFNRRVRRTNDIGGNAGTTEYFVNGALIIRQNVRAGNGIVHVIDRVLEKSISRPAYSYLKIPDTKYPNVQSAFFREFVNYLDGENFANTILPLQSATRLTLFLPSDEAINKIPKDKLEEIRSLPQKLALIIKQHVILDKVIYTSYVYHNEGFNAMYGRNLFKKNTGDKVYISGGGVNAEITKGNMTVQNGAIHIIDSVLGFVYNTAREQIQLDRSASNFHALTDRGRKELQDYLVQPSGVTVFVPNNDAFSALTNIPGADFYNNQTLINEVLERSMLEPGTAFEITNVNGDYTARYETTSQYRGMPVKIYSQGNDTWVEGGYVKARVLRPDVGVTNGFVHYIDGVFGVPSRDLPGLIYCEDWLLKTSYILSITNLNRYLKDTRITATLPACPSTAARAQNTYLNTQTSVNMNTQNSNTRTSNTNSPLLTGGCGESNRLCEFTVFIPNGTAIDNFQMTELGLRILDNRNRLRFVLKRHIILGKKIYIDTLGFGSHNLQADNGDYLRLNKINKRIIELYYKGQRTRVIHSDLGATNGVIHIVDRVLYEQDDLTRQISAATTIFKSYFIILSMLSLSLIPPFT
ncbi:transforming growth factor-beta-induced protein ig-h3 [Patella vulgata]|uniref:transforming growth factor-beta-induced protein ig-h3 n=1 Tax=Patella vulgata TaxID=6465 RepID=UPI00217F2C8F|nr:transforming growth factor-beta-induced protein ig-h3 [Patella vulgata]